jgi:hypothetical protein
MKCSMCGQEITPEDRKEAELSDVSSFKWMGHDFFVETIKRIRTKEDKPLCNLCWKKFIRMFIQP